MTALFVLRFIRMGIHLLENHLREGYLKPTFQTVSRQRSCCPGWRKPSGRDSPSQWQAKGQMQGWPGTASHTRPAYREANQGEASEDVWESCRIKGHSQSMDLTWTMFSLSLSGMGTQIPLTWRACLRSWPPLELRNQQKSPMIKTCKKCISSLFYI